MYSSLLFFFFNDTATTEIYTLSLHDALPICSARRRQPHSPAAPREGIGRLSRSHADSSVLRWPPGRRRSSAQTTAASQSVEVDRKSTRLNSSHSQISYAVFCLKKKKNDNIARVTMDSLLLYLQKLFFNWPVQYTIQHALTTIIDA